MTATIRLTADGVLQENGGGPKVNIEMDVFDKDGNLIVGGNGAGITVIPAGGTIGGTYYGDVVCQGAATLADDVTVNGDLTVVGDLNNSTGRQLTVTGDLKTLADFNFDRTNKALPQAPITVKGSWFSHGTINFVQTGGVPTSISVGHDFIAGLGGNAPIFCYGDFDTQGAGILVQGNFYAKKVALDGGDSASAQAGAGGSITVYGNMVVVEDISCRGGNSDTNTGFPAGFGGNIVVQGSLTCGYNIDVRGGGAEGPGENAGGAGLIQVYGDMNVTGFVLVSGGDSVLAGGNSGGAVTVYGDINCRGLETSGGSGATFGGYAGVLECRGNVTVKQNLSLNGGAGLSVGGGTAGSIEVRGNLIVGNELSANAGSGAIAGPYSPTAPEDSTIYVVGDLNVFRLNCNGGSATGGPASRGGKVIVRGNFTLGENMSISGGSSTIGEGGSGGQLNVTGNLTATPITTISLDGGASTTGGDGGDAGSLSVFGNVNVYDLTLSGGSSGHPTLHSGGNGGSVTVTGHAKCSSITLNGGSSPASRGSAGSFIGVGGLTCFSFVMKDGTGAGSAPSDNVSASLSGNCSIGTLDVTNRTGIQVKTYSPVSPVYLKINELGVGGKNTLNNFLGAQTNTITGDIVSCAFITDFSGNWYKLAGVSISAS